MVFVRWTLIAAAAAFLLLFGCAASQINEGVGSDGRAYRGADSPRLVIYEYSDFECPYCQKAQPAIESIMRSYQDRVQLRFRHYPLPSHPRAMPLALAGVCAEDQGKFWAMHDRIYANPDALGDSDLEKYVKEIGLDADGYAGCIKSGDAAAVVESDMAAAKAAGVRATPSFLIGQSLVEGADQSRMVQAIELELARQG